MLKSKKIKRLIGWAVFLLFCFAALILAVIMSLPSEKRYGTDYADIGYNDFGTDITELVSLQEEPTTVLENEHLALSVNSNGIIGLTQKSTGKVYSSALSDEKSGYFDEDIKDMQSSVSCEYLSDSINTSIMYSSDDAVKRSQYKISLSEDKTQLQVEYILGEKSEDSAIPKAIRREFFEKKLLKNLNEDDGEYLKRRYTLYSLDELTVYDDLDTLTASYPGLKKQDFYIATDMTNNRVREKTISLLKQAGYTESDLEDDNIASGVQMKKEIPIFHIAIRYSLEGEQLVMCVPSEEINYMSSYPLLSLNLQKFFLSSVGEDGALLIPSGSGALMKFYTDSKKVEYTSVFYGNDSTIVHKEMSEEMLNDTRLTLPVYGMISGGNGVLAIIEQGAEQASLSVKRDGQNVYAYTAFNVLQKDNVYIKNSKSSVALAVDDYSSDFIVRYHFIDEVGDDDYTRLSGVYRDYLLSKSLINEKTADSEPAIMLELIGGAELSREVLNLYTKTEMTAFTEFQKMFDIASNFISASNLNVKINGWSKRGLYSQVPGKTDVADVLGGKPALDNLIEKLEKAGINSYLEVGNMYYYNDTYGDGFNKNKVAHFADNGKAVLTQYDAVNGFYLKESLETLIVSPKYYTEFAGKYISSGYSSFALGRFCSDINSDYNSDSFYDRNRARRKIEETLALYALKGMSLTANDANLYALKYLDMVENMPADSGGNVIFDAEIPFKQMVLHGSLSYTTVPVNTASDFTTAVLKAIETGSGLKFVFTDNIAEEVFNSDYSYIYYTEFSRCAKRAVEAADILTTALKGLNNVPITHHTTVGSITKTTFENGTVIYVNYGDSAAEIDSVTVDSKSYMRKN